MSASRRACSVGGRSPLIQLWVVPAKRTRLRAMAKLAPLAATLGRPTRSAPLAAATVGWQSSGGSMRNPPEAIFAPQLPATCSVQAHAVLLLLHRLADAPLGPRSNLHQSPAGSSPGKRERHESGHLRGWLRDQAAA